MTSNNYNCEKQAKNEEYQYDDDILNIMPIAEKNTLIDEEQKNDGSSIKLNNIKKKNFYNSQRSANDNYMFKKVMNVITLILLELAVTGTLIFCIVENKVHNLYVVFQTQIKHFQITFEIFMAIWVMIILTLAISIFRNLFMMTKDMHEEQEIKSIITYKMNHYFYLGNIFALVILCLWNTKFTQKYGINILFSISSLIFYLLCYMKIKKITIKGLFNKVGFSISLSFTLSWMFLVFVLSILMCVETNNLSDNSLYFISISFHILIFSVSIIILGFYHDLFFVFLILLYQLGTVLMNKNEISFNENKIILVIIILTVVSFIFSLCCVRKTEENYNEEIVLKYDEEKEKSHVL